MPPAEDPLAAGPRPLPARSGAAPVGLAQERAALLASIQQSLSREGAAPDHAWAWVHGPQTAPPFKGDSPLYFMLEKGLPGLREVARLLVREGEGR